MFQELHKEDNKISSVLSKGEKAYIFSDFFTGEDNTKELKNPFPSLPFVASIIDFSFLFQRTSRITLNTTKPSVLGFLFITII